MNFACVLLNDSPRMDFKVGEVACSGRGEFGLFKVCVIVESITSFRRICLWVVDGPGEEDGGGWEVGGLVKAVRVSG